MRDDERNLVRRLLMNYGAFQRADRRSMLRPVFVGLALMTAEPSVAEPRNYEKFSEFCYGMMEDVAPAMRYANKVPRLSIEDVFEEVRREYPDTAIGKIALERASFVWMFGPMTRGELESEIMSVYDQCMDHFPQCIHDGLCIDE